MKKLLTIAFAMLLGATLSVAQATGGTTGSTDKPATGKPATSTKTKGHSHKKGGKKSKKSSGSTTTPAPK
jgi:hypothetical protein